MLKLPLRNKSVGTKVTEAEFEALEMRAHLQKLTLSEWVRGELLDMKTDDGGEALLGELLALRAILINLLFSLGKGERLTTEAMKEVIERADREKVNRAAGRRTDARLSVRNAGSEFDVEGLSMSEWGRKEYSEAWPSRTPVWTWTATLLSLAFFVGMLTLKCETNWTAAEYLYLTNYLKSGARGMVSATTASQYTLLEAVVGKGKRLVMENEIEQVPSLDGRPGYRLTDRGVKNGIARLAWVKGTFNDRGLHRIMSATVYDNVWSWDFYRIPVLLTAAFFVLALFLAVPKDRERRMIWKHGRRLRGPELVTTAEFNEKLGKSKLLTTHVPDGIALINEERSWIDKIMHSDLSRWARVPRDREAMHFPHRRRQRHWQERGYKTDTLAGLGARRSGNCVRPGDGISAAVLQRSKGRCGAQSARCAVPILDSRRRGTA